MQITCVQFAKQPLHRLDGTYIAFMGALMGFVLGHSVKEDYFSSGDKKPSP